MPQVLGQVSGGRVPLRGQPGQGLEANPLQLPRNGLVQLPRRSRIRRGDQVLQLGQRPGVEGALPGEQFVEDDAQAEDVGTAINPMPLAPGLFGAHVSHRACPGPVPAEVFLPQRQTEVGQVRGARPVQQDIARLDVAVHQFLAMGVMQRVGDTRYQGSCLDRAE